MGIVVLVVVALQFPKVQHFAAQKTASYLENSWGTRVDIGGFTTDWRNTIVLKEVYVEDQQQDTLWYSERLGLDMKIFSLLKSEVDISRIHLQNATAKLHIRPDSTANYDFILEAFATDTTAQPADTTAAPMKISLDVINLENIYLDFRDEAGGNLIRGRIGQLHTTMDKLDLEQEIYRLNDVELKNTAFRYVQTKLPPDTEPEPITMQFGLKRVDLENIKLSYVSKVSSQRVELDLGKSELVADNIDLPNARVDLKSFDLHNTSLAYAQEKYTPSDSLTINPEKTVKKLDESVEKTRGQPVKWVVNLNKLNVSGVEASINNYNVPEQPQGMDFDHLHFTDVEIDADNFLFSLNRMGIELNQLKLKEKSGFAINHFNADIAVDSTRASLTNLDLRTNNSNIGPELTMRYPSYAAISENPELISFTVDMQESRLGMRDVLFFAPDLSADPSFRKIAGSTLQVDGQAAGTLDNLNIRRLQVAGLQGTRVDVSGNIRNATDPDRLYLDLRINRLATTRTDVLALTPPDVLPPNLRVPNSLNVTGTYRGSLTAFDTDLDIRSSAGNITAKVDMGQGPKGAEPFRATVNINKLNVRELLTDSLGLGTVTLRATASGTGLTPETMRAKVQARVQELRYNNYIYNNIDVNATVNQNLYTVNATSKDENIAFVLNGDFNLRNSEKPAYAFTLDLQEANLHTLNFYPEPLSIQGNMKGNFTGADARTLSGTLLARELVVSHNQRTFPVDSLWLNLNQEGEMEELQLRSDIADADIHFENSLATFPTALAKHFSNYFDLHPDPPYPANVNLGDIRMTAVLKKSDLITAFVPGLEQLSVTDTITAVYDGDTQQLNMDARINTIKYTDYTLRNLEVQVRGNREQLGYNLNLQQLLSPSLKVDKITLSGAARDNDITMRLAVGDSAQQEEQFVVGGLFNSLGTGYRFTFNPDQLVINGDKWSVPQDNYLQFDTNLLYAHNIRLERGDSFISLNSTGPVSPNAPLEVQLNNFDIGYVMQNFQQQDSLVAGIVNGTATLTNILSGAPGFTSDLTVTDFAYMGVPVGNIALEASSAANNRYNINTTLTGNGNQMLLTGFYEAQPNAGLLNLDANISSLNLASLEGFTMGTVKDMGGSASGRLRITGTLDSPSILGDLHFSQAQFNISMLNSVYRLQNERLVFSEEGIGLNNFTLTDTLGNTMVVNGNILTPNYQDYRFNLTAKTDRFLAMNSTAQDNDLFYGTVQLAANATITGNMVQPEIEVDVRVLDGSTFTAVIPAENVGVAAREGIVEFVDLNSTLTAILGQQVEADTTSRGFIGANIKSSINVTDATTITIVIDPITGDHLEVRGNASPLYVGMTPSGMINMSGRYEITEGKYRMEFFDLASRELDIAGGSYIYWTGDPMLGDMLITAIYNIQAAPMELIASQAPATENPALRNRLPFELHVIVEGELLKPEIRFDIRLPEDDRGVMGGIVESSLGNLRQDEAEMNKQVFSLLVLGRFMAPDPFTSSGSSFSGTARNSLSQVMTDQLNQLTQRHAGGLGLEFGVNSYEDYSSGTGQGRTDLNVALRQQFLDDRLTVRVGSDIGIEGQSEPNRNTNGFAGDVSVEYSLTEDGRLRVRGFQRNQYEGYLEGDVRATGVALIFSREYNNFSDLFRSLESRREKNMARRLKSAAKAEEKL